MTRSEGVGELFFLKAGARDSLLESRGLCKFRLAFIAFFVSFPAFFNRLNFILNFFSFLFLDKFLKSPFFGGHRLFLFDFGGLRSIWRFLLRQSQHQKQSGREYTELHFPLYDTPTYGNRRRVLPYCSFKFSVCAGDSDFRLGVSRCIVKYGVLRTSL